MSTESEELLARQRRTLRAATGQSQADVVERAKAAGHSLSLDTLTAAEAGRSISERSLRAICAGLGCTVASYVTPGTPVVVET